MGSWHRAHGEGKASTHGRFTIETMQATNGEYLVRVIEVSHTVVGPFAIPGPMAPTEEAVVSELRKRVLEKKK